MLRIRQYRGLIVHQQGWNASYTGSSSWPASGASTTGVGSLYFRTQLPGASVDISFFGGYPLG